MKMFAYYALHTLKNQLKKLFKTWVLIFLAACLAIGFIIGFGLVALENLAMGDDYVEEVVEDEVIDAEPIDTEEMYAVVELMCGGIILLLIVFSILGADKNGSSIFQPADVNLLFPSPLKPQSVLLFRLTTQLGVILVSSIYLCISVPKLIINMGLGAVAVVGFLCAWTLAVVLSRLLQILIYTFCSTHIKLKRYIRICTYGLLTCVALGYFAYTNITGLNYYTSAKAFFNARAAYLIPIWGTLKAMCAFSLTGNVLYVALSIAIALIMAVVLAIVIWRIKADFYEDAMAKSQETAELMQAAQNDGGVVVKRKKDRSEKLRRDGMKRGSGATVFFYRSMYNRFRFAHFSVLTATSETYMLAALGVCALCKFVFETTSPLPAMLTIGVLSFFRTLRNPLSVDTSRDFFRLIPEKTFAKLFYSTLGGSVNCALDLVPAALITIIFLGANPLYVLALMLLILSVDLYGTATGAFIDLSVQVSAGKIIKQIVQIMFIYFGLIPDIAIMAIGIILGIAPIAALICAVLNIGLGMLFLSLSPLFIDYCDKKK